MYIYVYIYNIYTCKRPNPPVPRIIGKHQKKYAASVLYALFYYFAAFLLCCASPFCYTSL